VRAVTPPTGPELGGTAAAVFWPEVPQSFWGSSVINGDEHDARFLDPAGTIVGLKAKGSAKSDLSGFVIRQPQSLPESNGQFALAA
jgi:hypothetical protein